MQQEVRRAPLRVLLVEDSEDDALLILRELRRGGYEPEYERVETSEAMERALAQPWDVIFSDYRLPSFDAPEALKMWYASGSESPFIVVSGKVGEDVAARAIKAGAYDYVMKDNLTRLHAVVERSLQEAREKRDLRRAGKELQRRDAILDAVRFAADQFLGETVGWEESVRTVLKRLGEATGASRDYVFENYVGEDGELWATQRYEWVAASVSAQIDNPVLKAIPYRAAGFGRWVQALGRGDLVYGHVRDFPESEQPGLRAQEILSIALVPIFVEGRWWGVIGFDECIEEREWSAAEVGALGAAARTLGAAIKRRQMEERLRAGEERYRAVIEQATDGIYLLDAQTRGFVETNPSFQKMVGYTADELRGMDIYRIVNHPRWDVDATIQRTLELRRRVVGNRKYRRKDGAVLDVEVGVSVISLGGREVICTIVRDVTERARMQALLEERVATLSRIAADVVLDLPMEDTLNALSASAVRASTAVSCLIVLIDDEEIRLAGTHGVPEGYEAVYEKDGATSPNREAIRSHKPMLYRDASRSFYPRGPWDSVYVVPLLSRGKTLGAIDFAYPPGQEPGEEEKVFLGAVADQAAVAVENARLFSEARGKAALEERQRLARELHDSVSQALYGITLGVETARELLPDNPEGAAEPLEYAVTLAEAGMTEMRALIFELRPESLEKEGLVAALEKQAAAVQARHAIRVETAFGEEPNAPLETKESLYRITQEALHNTIKHARANNVKIKLARDFGLITLEISDDGAGFDAHGDFPGHLGLKSMRERASRQGGTLEIVSRPGKGVRILARIPCG